MNVDKVTDIEPLSHVIESLEVAAPDTEPNPEQSVRHAKITLTVVGLLQVLDLYTCTPHSPDAC